MPPVGSTDGEKALGIDKIGPGGDKSWQIDDTMSLQKYFGRGIGIPVCFAAGNIPLLGQKFIP